MVATADPSPQPDMYEVEILLYFYSCPEIMAQAKIRPDTLL
jgi:hypothetical protein